MHRFFDRPDTRWRSLHGALHFYVLPPAEGSLLATHDRVARALHVHPGLAVQPAEYVHMTLQRLDGYRPEIDDDTWAVADRRISEAVSRTPQFCVEYAAPRPNGHAVEAIGSPNPQWQRLVEAIRSAVTASGLGGMLTPAPYGPHYTSAYCVADTDDAAVVDSLRGVGHPTDLVVDDVALVAVDQFPDEGVFTFEVLRTWSLP
ncbi:2'-5' RNA ligase family protein [Micropruina sp.]|uniref:2'-5' RNA ligase family protein n=1 Tax=Micropruina sp. TaxID=2737536 RepID=UPI0039E301AC